MLSYAKRAKSRQTVTYAKIKDIWAKSSLNSFDNYGDTGYLIREAAVNLRNTEGITALKRKDWAQYYLRSGQIRQKNQSSMSTTTNDVYYGRTLDNLYKLGEDFLEEVKSIDASLKVDAKSILNFIYSEVLDDTYRNYVLISKINISLKTCYPLYSFDLSGPQDYLNSGIDAVVLKDGIETAAIKILFNKQTPDMLDGLELQKHKLFSDCNLMPVMYLTLDYEGNPVNTLPLLS
jgi:hypothetical protein